MNEQTIIILPDKEEIINRLKKVEMGVYNYMTEQFYPLIAQEGGRKLIARDVVIMLTIKIHYFVQSCGYLPMMEGVLHMYVPQFIDALIDDKDVADQAKHLHQEAIDAANKGGYFINVNDN